MKLIGWWTFLMSLALALVGTGLAWQALGGGWIALLGAVPGMFLWYHLVGLPLVLVCELGSFIPKSLRPHLTEFLIVVTTVGASFYLFPKHVALAVLGFFSGMYLLRLLFRKAWVPGEPEEVSK